MGRGGVSARAMGTEMNAGMSHLRNTSHEMLAQTQRARNRPQRMVVPGSVAPTRPPPWHASATTPVPGSTAAHRPSGV